MIQASLLEQIATFWKILISNKFIWIVLAIALGLVLLLSIGSKFHNKKITKILYTIAYLGVFGTLIGFFHTEILELLDYLVNNIFLFLFFPNLAVYTLVIVLVNVIIIKSTFSKDNKLIKGVNIIFFIVFNIIFYLIIDNVVKNNINVYEQLSIYTNNNLLVLIELSMKLFVVWVLLLGIIKVTKSLVFNLSIENKKVVVKEKKELLKVNTLSKVMNNKNSDTYIEIPEIVNNDIEYVDIVPIKKTKKVEEKVEVAPIEQLEEITPVVTEEAVENVPEVIETEVPEVSSVVEKYEEKIPEVAPVVQTLEVEEETQEEVKEIVNPFDNFNIVHEVEEVKPVMITLSSYDSIFNVNKEIEHDMDVVFENNKLDDIMGDIHELGKNIDDEKIKKVYDNIVVSQDDLSLSDYNYLINELASLKK